MNEGLMNIASSQAGQVNKQYNKSVNIQEINNGLVVYYKGDAYYCKTVAQVSKFLKEIFPDE